MKCRDEIEELKNVADGNAAEQRQLMFIERRDFLIVEKEAAVRRAIDGSDEVQQRRFAAPRRSHEDGELPAGNVQRDVFQHLHSGRFVAAAVDMCDMLEADAQGFSVYREPNVILSREDGEGSQSSLLEILRCAQDDGARDRLT